MQVTEVVNIPDYPTCTRCSYFHMDDFARGYCWLYHERLEERPDRAWTWSKCRRCVRAVKRQEEEKMKAVDITECLTSAIEKIILGEWRHEGYIDVMHTHDAHVVIDGQKYVITIEEVRETTNEQTD